MATPNAARHRDLEQRLKDLEDAVRQVRGVIARRPQFEVSSGDLTINGGDVVMLDTDGDVLFRLGAQQYGDRGLTIARENGFPAFELKRDGSSPFLKQTWRLTDNVGNVIVGEWAFGEGLSRPRIPVPVHPVSAPASWGVNGPEVATTSSTFVTAFRADYRRQNPLYNPVLSVVCSDATTSAAVQIVDKSTGLPLDDFFGGGDWLGNVPTGSTTFVDLTPALTAPGVYDQRIQLDIQVRRTAGAGTVKVAIPLSSG